MTNPRDIMGYAYKGQVFTKSGLKEFLVREGVSPLKVHDLTQLLQSFYDMFLEAMGGQDESDALYDPQNLPQPIFRYAYEAILAQGVTPHFVTGVEVQQTSNTIHALERAQRGDYYYSPAPVED